MGIGKIFYKICYQVSSCQDTSIVIQYLAYIFIAAKGTDNST